MGGVPLYCRTPGRCVPSVPSIPTVASNLLDSHVGAFHFRRVNMPPRLLEGYRTLWTDYLVCSELHRVQGYFAHEKTPPPSGTPLGP